MPLSVNELIEKAKEQRGRKRYEEALVSALAAAEQDDENSEAWWQVALSRSALGDTKNTIAALRKTVKLNRGASNAWARLGDLLLKEGETKEAKDAFEWALIYDAEQTMALEGMSSIYADENDADQDADEISVLERIEKLSGLSKFQINRFGIVHYRNGRYHEAIRCWKMDVWNADHPSQRFNLGLAYNRDTISQDADAIDMWRLALRDWPDYEPPKKSISNVLPRLLELSLKARQQGESILPHDQWFDHYMNPFQLLNPPEDADFDELDPKAIQKLKKTLMQEIELEDGKVTWMPNVVIEKSRAIGLCDELNDDEKKYWHWEVFSNKSLLAFLTKGAHEHFLVNAHESPLATIDGMEWDDDFREWLGKLFAPQFDRVLTKAIDQGNAVLVECLLDGRRWVPESMIDACFMNTQRAVERLVKPLHDFRDLSEKLKPSVADVEGLFRRGNLLEIMNLLPVFFEKQQNDVVHSVRALAVKAFNVHNDIDLSRRIIELAKRFKFRSADANKTIEEDIETIEDLIRQQRKHEAKLTKGDEDWEITKEGVRQGSRFVAAADITAIRWGALITSENGSEVWDFLIGFKADDGRRLVFQWKVNERDLEKHRGFFDNLVRATLSYIFPSLIERTEARLASGFPVHIGPCKVDRQGVRYEVKGWIFTDEHFVPWHRVRHFMENGELIVIDASDAKKRVSLSVRDTDNAHLLRILVDIKNGTDN